MSVLVALIGNVAFEALCWPSHYLDSWLAENLGQSRLLPCSFAIHCQKRVHPPSLYDAALDPASSKSVTGPMVLQS